ncbi:hypothetical protein MNBD_GAMMA12-2803 [hydrothermal vent metagenome]|uniref:Uncharacterized protein n=1 Tax=hydrothermal vent metagenome TaxID=652676 RepID=A0A3B0YKB6_9ZZZZ
MLGQETVNIKYKPRFKSIFFLAVEIGLMALPATVVWLYTIYQLHSGVLVSEYSKLYFFALIFSGFGLFSLWWLSVSTLRSVRYMRCREIPLLVKIGVGSGILMSTVLVVFAALFVKNNIWAFWIFFCPLILSLHLLIISKPNTDKNA